MNLHFFGSLLSVMVVPSTVRPDISAAMATVCAKSAVSSKNWASSDEPVCEADDDPEELWSQSP